MLGGLFFMWLGTLDKYPSRSMSAAQGAGRKGVAFRQWYGVDWVG